MIEHIITQEDLDRGYILLPGDKKVIVLHANVGDVVRLRFVEGEVSR